MNRLYDRYRPWVLGGAAVVVVLFLVFFATHLGPRAQPDPGAHLGVKTPAGKDSHGYRPVVTGFYENPGTSTKAGSLPSLKANSKQIQIVAPYWYRIDGHGKISVNNADASVTRLAHARHVRIWPLIGNQGSKPLQSHIDVKATADRIAALVKQKNYDGAFIDFELIPPWTRDNLTAMLDRLGKQLHKHGKKLGVAVFPKVGVASSITKAYNYPALGKITDMVVIMAYDKHQNSSPPGPVAPLSWVKSNVEYGLKYVPAQKLFLGVAAYGYDWSSGGSAKTVSTRQATALWQKQGVKPIWSKTVSEPFFTYHQAGATHTVWYEDTSTFLQKLALAKQHHLGGIALWRLGFEEPSLWRELQKHS